MTILYPTETLYALGVNAFDPAALAALYEIKEREEGKAVSVLVRSVEDVERFAHMPPKAKLLAAKFLPGPLTLVLKARDEVPRHLLAPDGTLGFRVSSDEVAKQVINDFMSKYDAPLTCTSANVSGFPTLSTPKEILEQLGDKADLIDEIHDGGPRVGAGSTVIRVLDDKVEILRLGAVPESAIKSVLRQ
ncbi:MAG: threonylcarbamoyl-AMP synthase [Candidatus Nomurabacteria bacterium]|nr:threonylcarbamoyl-AMP synthase [Candidatus Nomurabacteria bacterium]USN87632.1 MAG: threonylcarbamoyl-AMP synthase [Candidatus Nomurabacteria bacterium]